MVCLIFFFSRSTKSSGAHLQPPSFCFRPLDPLPSPRHLPTTQYDTVRDDFFFLDSAKTLWYWDRQTPVLTQIATAPQMGINSFTLPANAVYYNDGFWFIKEGGPAVTTQTLIEIVFTYGGSGPVYSGTKVRVSFFFFLVGVGGWEEGVKSTDAEERKTRSFSFSFLRKTPRHPNRPTLSTSSTRTTSLLPWR